MDTTIPSTFRAIFCSFAGVFTAPSFENFMTLATGWMLCAGRHTISGVIRAGAGRARKKHFSTLYRFFSRAVWDVDAFGKALFHLVLALAGEVVLAVVDDTLCPRSGPHFWGAGMHHDPLRSTCGRGSSAGRWFAMAFGHNWVVLAIWVRVPWNSARGVAAPILLPRKQPKRGRRLKGRRLRSPEELAAAKSVRWRTLKPVIYGRKVGVLVKTQVGMWYGVAHTRLVRVVVTRDPSGRIEDRACFTTELDLSVEEILGGFSRRWSLEVTFHDAKQSLGLEDSQNGWWRRPKRRRRRKKRPGPHSKGRRGERTVRHTVPLIFCVYGLVIVWYLRHGDAKRDVERARRLSPWYRHKREPSFADMLGAVRRELWAARIMAYPSLRRIRRNIITLIPDWMAAA